MAHQSTLFGFSHNPNWTRSLRDKSRTKQPLGKDLDAHDRDYAPLIAEQRYKREFDIASDKIKTLEKKLGKDLQPGQAFPKAAALRKEIAFRKDMIINGTRLLDGCKKKVDAMVEYWDKHDEDVLQSRQTAINQVAKVFPELKEYVVKIQTMVEGEMHRIRSDNTRLQVENTELKLISARGLNAEEVSTALQDFLNGQAVKSDKDEESVKSRLAEQSLEFGRLQGQFEIAKDNWETLRLSLEAEREKLHQKVLQLEEKENNYNLEIRDKDRLVTAHENERKSSADKIETLQGELVTLQKNLESAEEQVGLERSRTDQVQHLKNLADAEVENRDQQIAALNKLLADASKPRTVELTARERNELFALRLEALQHSAHIATANSEGLLDKERYEKLRTKMAAKHKQNQSLQSELDTARRTNETQQQTIDDMAAEKQQIQCAYEEEITEYLNLFNEDLEKSTQIQALETANSVAQDNLARTQDALSQSKAFYSAELDRSRDLKAQIDTLSASLRAGTDNFNADRQILIERYELQTARATMAVNSAAALTKTKDDVERQLWAVTDSLEDLQVEKETIAADLERSEQALEILRHGEDTVAAALQVANRNLEILQEEKEAVVVERDRLGNSLQTMRQEREVVEGKFQKALEKINEIKDTLQSFQPELIEVRNPIEPENSSAINESDNALETSPIRLPALNLQFGQKASNIMDRRVSEDSRYVGFGMSRQHTNEPQYSYTPQRKGGSLPHLLNNPQMEPQYLPAVQGYLTSQSVNSPQQFGRQNSPFSGPPLQRPSVPQWPLPDRQLGHQIHRSLTQGYPHHLNFTPGTEYQAPRRSNLVLQQFGYQPHIGDHGYSPQLLATAQASRSQPVTSPTPGRGYTFLTSGFLADGLMTDKVSSELIAKIDRQIVDWSQKKGEWSAWTQSSEKRCVDVRRQIINVTRAPPADDPSGNVACKRCIERKKLCVLIGTMGPVIVPLPLGKRAQGIDPSQLSYYIIQ